MSDKSVTVRLIKTCTSFIPEFPVEDVYEVGVMCSPGSQRHEDRGRGTIQPPNFGTDSNILQLHVSCINVHAVEVTNQVDNFSTSSQHTVGEGLPVALRMATMHSFKNGCLSVLHDFLRFAIIGLACRRGVAQPGSALEWGSRGPAFESRRPDHEIRVKTARMF